MEIIVVALLAVVCGGVLYFGILAIIEAGIFGPTDEQRLIGAGWELEKTEWNGTVYKKGGLVTPYLFRALQYEAQLEREHLGIVEAKPKEKE